MNPNFSAIRNEYRLKILTRDNLLEDPLKQLGHWLKQAIEARHPEATAIALASADPQGCPSVRMVLAKDVSEKGVSFFTNYNSPKGNQLEANPSASITFFWMFMERQVRLDGTVSRIPESDSDAYFASRPRESQIGAWASPQSQPVKSRQALEELFEAARRRFGGKEVPRPPHWGGYILKPTRMEFWQGRTGRMHDRFEYRKEGDKWNLRRLAP